MTHLCTLSHLARVLLPIHPSIRLPAWTDAGNICIVRRSHSSRNKGVSREKKTRRKEWRFWRWILNMINGQWVKKKYKFVTCPTVLFARSSSVQCCSAVGKAKEDPRVDHQPTWRWSKCWVVVLYVEAAGWRNDSCDVCLKKSAFFAFRPLSLSPSCSFLFASPLSALVLSDSLHWPSSVRANDRSIDI